MRQFKVREFAERSGVTVRTLHHYDSVGLLRPSYHTESGYRLYSERDLARLQQIVTLKFIGLSLKQIRELLDGGIYDLAEMLRVQRTMLEQKRQGLDMAIQALSNAERTIAEGGSPDGDAFENIIRVINMENNKEWMKNYYSADQLEQLDRRWTEESDSIAQTQKDWAALIAEVEASLHEDPAGERAQALAARWQELIDRFTLGDTAMAASLEKLYADQANWPATFTKPYSDEVEAFMHKAMAIRRLDQANGS